MELDTHLARVHHRATGSEDDDHENDAPCDYRQHFVKLVVHTVVYLMVIFLV
jgi:hypothetical protein